MLARRHRALDDVGPMEKRCRGDISCWPHRMSAANVSLLLARRCSRPHDIGQTSLGDLNQSQPPVTLGKVDVLLSRYADCSNLVLGFYVDGVWIILRRR